MVYHKYDVYWIMVDRFFSWLPNSFKVFVLVRNVVAFHQMF